MASGQGTSLKSYLLTRLALVVPMVLILLTFVFLLMRVAPGDPISAALGGHAPQSVIDQIKHNLGFDRPLWKQYLDYLRDIFTGNFGTTITDRRCRASCRAAARPAADPPTIATSQCRSIVAGAWGSCACSAMVATIR